MLLNLDMIVKRMACGQLKKDLKGHEPLLCLEKWRIYDGESELSSSVLYLAEASRITGRVKGPSESAMLVCGTADQTDVRLDCPNIFIDSGTISFEQLINSTIQAFCFYEQIDRQLMQALYDGEPFQKFVDIISPVMSNELILMNSDFKLIGQTYERSRLYERNNFVQDMGPEYIPSEVLSFFKNDPIYASVRDEKEPFVYQASVHNVDIWCMNVFLNDQFMCRVTMPESEHKFRPYDRELLRYFTGFIQKKYNDLRADDNYQQESRLSGLLLRLLEGKNVEESALDQALGQYRLGTDRTYRCIYIQPSERDYYNKTLSAYCEYLEKHYPGAVAFEYDGSIVCILIVPDQQAEQEKQHAGLVEFLRDNYLKAGFSHCFSRFKELSAYFHQAGAALKTGLSHSPFKWVFSFQKECLIYMKQLVTAELPPEHLCSPKLLELLSYDMMHKTDYADTLYIYMENGRNAVETARKLFLHRSTMMYRLKRIREISGIDFHDPDEMLYLMISIRLLR